jgi:hypothetical protein
MNKLRVHTVPNGKLDAKGQDLRVDLVDEDGREHLFPVQSLVLRCAGRCEPVVIEVVVAQRDIEVDVTGNSGVLDFEGKEGKD